MVFNARCSDSRLVRTALTCLHQLVEQVQPERKKCNVRPLVKVYGGALCIENTDAGDEFIRVATSPFVGNRLVANLVFDVHGRLGRSDAGHDITQNLLLPACATRLLENANVAGLTRAVVAVDDGEAGRELESLIFRERIYALVMEY